MRYIALGAQSVSDTDVLYIVRTHSGLRVHPRDDVDKLICAIEAAARVSVDAMGMLVPLAASIRIAQLYSYAMLKAIEHGRAEKASELLIKIRSLASLGNKVRIKNELVYCLVRLFGTGLAVNVVGLVRRR